MMFKTIFYFFKYISKNTMLCCLIIRTKFRERRIQIYRHYFIKITGFIYKNSILIENPLWLIFRNSYRIDSTFSHSMRSMINRIHIKIRFQAFPRILMSEFLIKCKYSGTILRRFSLKRTRFSFPMRFNGVLEGTASNGLIDARNRFFKRSEMIFKARSLSDVLTR